MNRRAVVTETARDGNQTRASELLAMQEEQKKLTIERFEDGFQRNAGQAVEDRIARVALELIASPNRLQNAGSE